jgi:hypothetical protein
MTLIDDRCWLITINNNGGGVVVKLERNYLQLKINETFCDGGQ